jgi:hypothetical protein
MTEGGNMTLENLRAALAWCTVINLGLLVVWWLFFALAHDWIRRVHSKWFNLSRERFDTIHYGAMALFKIGIVLLNLVPYLSLRIAG